MKILFISNGFPPQQWAGTETYTAGIAQALLHRGHQVQILCGGDWEKGEDYWNGYTDEVYNELPVRRIHLNWTKAPDPFLYLYNNPIMVEFLTNYLQGVKPDVVHVTSCERLSASVLEVVKKAGKPLVLSLTDFWYLCPRINLLRSNSENCRGLTTAWECLRCQLFDAKAYQWPRRLLPEKSVEHLLTAVSHHPILTRRRGLRGMAGDMAARKKFLCQALYLPDIRITASSFVRDIFLGNDLDLQIKVQPYGHDLDWLEKYKGKTKSEVIRVGFVGQIIPSKGVHLLLQAARILKDHYDHHFSIQIYGNLNKVPDYGVRLHALAANMPNVRFCGTYAHEESAQVFANIDILVVPSLWYDFPLIIYEAFATETPVIATNLGGMAEAVIHERNGLLFTRDDVSDLANQLQRIICEPALLPRLIAGVPDVKTIAEEVVELEGFYKSLVYKHNP